MAERYQTKVLWIVTDVCRENQKEINYDVPAERLLL